METKFKPVLQTKIDQDADKQKKKEKKDRPKIKRKKICLKDNLCVIFLELAVKTVFTHSFFYLLALASFLYGIRKPEEFYLIRSSTGCFI